jgi:hypothetical protein
LGFAVAPRNIPVLDILTNVESAITYLPSTMKEDIRKHTKEVVMDEKEKELSRRQLIPRDSIPEDLARNLRSKNCVYIKAEKGDNIVILDTEEYERRMNVLIEEGPYERVTNNPLDNMVNKAKDGIHGAINDLNLSAYFQYALKVSNPKVPQMYGLPKIHKPGEKMRPIVSNINSPFQKLSKWLVGELKTLPPVNGLYVKNSIEFCELSKNVILKRDEVLVAFDVISLFPSEPVDEAIKCMHQWFREINLNDIKRDAFIKVAKCCLV